MSFPEYEHYKDSGIEWLGEVPAHWETKKIGHLAKLITGFPFPSDCFDFNADNGVRLVRGDNVTEGYLRWGEKGRYWPHHLEYDENFLLAADDIVVQMDGSKVGKNWALIQPDDLPALLVQRVTRIRVTEQVLPDFAYALISSNFFVRYVDQAKTDPAIPHITMKNIRDYWIPLPPITEQKCISAFLKREITKLDALITEQRTLIDLLKEKRQAVISHAVTKGLDPRVPMKDSGVEWLGEVPAHWDVKSIKWLSSVLRGASPRPIDDQKYFDPDGEYAWVRIADASASDGLLVETTQRLSALGSSLSVKLEPGQLFISIAGTVGKPCIAGIKACIHDGFVYFPRLAIDPAFLYRIFEAGNCYAGLGKMGTQLNLNTDTIGSIRIAVPPRQELEQLMIFMDRETTKLDTLTAEAETIITLLQERRSALISAAVTGKIDVRHVHQPEPA